MADAERKAVPLSEATTDDLAEAVAAGVHVGLRRLFNDPEALRWLRDNGDAAFGDLPPR